MLYRTYVSFVLVLSYPLIVDRSRAAEIVSFFVMSQACCFLNSTAAWAPQSFLKQHAFLNCGLELDDGTSRSLACLDIATAQTKFVCILVKLVWKLSGYRTLSRALHSTDVQLMLPILNDGDVQCKV